MNKTEMPLLSVVVPVYDTEKYLRKCLDSILAQTYKNIEIIVVNNGSTDNSDNIIKNYMAKNDNIKYVYHRTNRGLFQARISGAEEADGDYIAFLDSDDHISRDYYRLLIRKAIESQSDMVVGNFCYEFEDGRMEYQNLDPFQTQNITLEGEDVLKAFMEQEGLCFTWNLVWNKIYKKSLWDKGYNLFKAFSERHPDIVMPEDLAYSSFFWSNANKICNVNSAVIYYFQRSSKSSNITNASVNTTRKYLSDIIAVFDFFKEVLIQSGKYEAYRKNYEAWKLRYARMYFDNFSKKGIIDELADELKTGLFGNEDMCGQTFEDTFFYSMTTPVETPYKWYDQIKERIASDETEYVSFDIFDTVVVRPFWMPSDLFRLLNPLFKRLTGAVSDIDFAKLRIESENSCRNRMKLIHPSFEDITLNEIYEEIQNKYFLSDEVTDKMMNAERELEKRFCTVRRSAFELYQLALDMGKKVIFISDMYLPLNTITEILHKNGYTKYERIFVSSDIRLTKHSGNLFKYVLGELNIEYPGALAHIGDNWETDVVMPQKFKMYSFHLDKAVNIFQNINQGIYGGESFSLAFENNPNGKDMHWAVYGFIGLRTMLAVVANKIFDNPYASFNRRSDFNACPFYIGYYPLGMYLYAITVWLINRINNRSISKIHFVARDGYLVRKAYDILVNARKDNYKLPQSNYLYLSRKALLLTGISQRVDMYSLFDKCSALAFTPFKFTELFKGLLSKETYDEFMNSLEENDFFPNKNIESTEESERFVHYFTDKLWDKIEWNKSTDLLKGYFEGEICEKDALFDIGYSGRAESALKSILGFAPDSFYIHSNTDILNRRESENGFNNELFYNYKPNITGVLREHLFMELSPSTIGYIRGDNGKISPVFEKYDINKATELITKTVQNYALEFVKDMINIFGDDLQQLFFREEDATAPFEYFLNYGKKVDRNVFASLVFEDNLSEGKSFRAVDFWGKEIERTLNMQKAINPSERILMEHEYIGIKAPKKYKRTTVRTKTNTIRVSMFMDKIKENDPIDDKFAKCAGNLNNVIEWEAAEKLISPQLIDNWYMTNPGGFSDGDYDVFLTTGLTEIHENADLTYLGKVLDKIGNYPLLPITVGFSAVSEKSDFKLSDSSVKVLRRIAERCKSIGVKGDYSAEVLKGFGISNIRIVGTPSLYVNISAEKDINNSASNIESVSASFRPFYGAFSEHESKLMRYFSDNSFRLVCASPLKLTETNIKDRRLLEKLQQYDWTRKMYFDSKKWMDSFDSVDFAMGMNFFNNAAALAAGVPALFINYESTGREMCRLFGLPSIEIDQFDARKPVEHYYQMADYTEFSAKIEHNFEEYKAYLTENGISSAASGRKIIEK